MPIKPLRRLDVRTARSAYDRLQQDALSCAWSRADVEPIERGHPELMIEEDGDLLVAFGDHGCVSLAYSFRSERAFIDHFPAMFKQLMPRARRALGAETVRFRLTYGPARPVVEPVLRNLWFEPERSWIEFSLARGRTLPATPPLTGVKFRDATTGDFDEIVRIDRECFPGTPKPAAVIRSFVESGDQTIFALAGREVAGMAQFSMPESVRGYLRVLAVREAYRGRGVGEALTMRAARRVFAAGAQRMDLKTTDENSSAIRLYVRLGLKHTAAGRDYQRLADDRVIARLQKAREGTFIKFGGWR